MSVKPYPRITFYALAIFALLIAFIYTGTISHAQDETSVPTLEAELTPEPTAEPTEAPLPPDDQAYVDTITRLAELIETLTAGDGAQQVAAMLAAAPGWVSIGVLIGIGIAYIVTRITKTKADDAIFDRVFGPLLNLFTGVLSSALSLVRTAQSAHVPQAAIKTQLDNVERQVAGIRSYLSETETGAEAGRVPPTPEGPA